MDNRLSAVFIVLAIDLLAIWLLWSKVFENNLKVEITPLEKTTLQFFGMPILAGIAILLLLGLMNTIVSSHQTAQFFRHLFRFTLVTIVLSIGANGLLHAIFVWPQRNENPKGLTFVYFLVAMPAFGFLALGIFLLVKFFQFS